MSAAAFPDAPAAAVFGPAVTTSRNELPPATAPTVRRPLALREPAVLTQVLSLVLEASDLESSGCSLDRGGAMVLM